MTDRTEHFRIEQLDDGLYAAIATEDGFGLCNAGIVDLGGTTLVFDAMLTPQAGTALGRAAERLTGAPVGLLVNSHYHGDHVRGNAAVGAVHVVSTARVRDLIAERGPVHLRSDTEEAARELARLRSGELAVGERERRVFEGWFEGILATPKELELRTPDLTFASEMVVHGRRRTARLLTFGGGHSPSDVLLQLPDERVVFLGDLLSVGFHPSLMDGDPEELVRILGQVRELGADRALPGHGPVSPGTSVREMERYVSGMLARARQARERGLSREEFGSVPAEPPFDGWTFSQFFADNSRFVYDWLGRPRPTTA